MGSKQQGPRGSGVAGQCAALVHLNLSHNHIGAYGAECLARVLLHLFQCPALFHLDLSHNGIDTFGAERFPGLMGQCTTMTHLNLTFNNLGATGAESLAGVLVQCTELAHLNLTYNEIKFRDRLCSTVPMFTSMSRLQTDQN
jgi:Ran GTPase-activating protein (RanGAP) involved in mRNA processing and transport